MGRQDVSAVLRDYADRMVACLAAFPAGFDGDYMIEVDVPSLPLRECHQLAYDWAVATLPLARPDVEASP